MDAVDVGLRLAGAFYAFGGVVAARAALMSHMIDGALGNLEGALAGGNASSSSAGQLRAVWLAGFAVLITAGGLALLALLWIAAPLFVVNAIGQAVYLGLLAPLYFDPHDSPDEQGRRQTVNAFVLYLAATALVLWAAHSARLANLGDVHWLVPALGGATVLALAGYVVRGLRSNPSDADVASAFRDASGVASGAAASDASDEDQEDDIVVGLNSVLVKAEIYRFPIHAYQPDKYGDIAPEVLALSPELERDLLDWSEELLASIGESDASVSAWSDAQRADHTARGRPLAERLARERPDLAVHVVLPDGNIDEV